MTVNFTNPTSLRTLELLQALEAGTPPLMSQPPEVAKALVAPDAFDVGSRALEVQDTSPVGLAQNAIAREQMRTEADKYTFDTKTLGNVSRFNEGRARDNLKTQGKIDELDGKISQELQKSGGQENGKIKKLEEERDKRVKELKPPVDPEQITAEIDGVMNQPNLSDDEKKKQLEEIRNHYGLSKNKGPLSMNTFTTHLSKVDGASKDRLGKMQKEQDKQLDDQLNFVKKTYGKNSPEFKALEAQKKAVDTQVFKPEMDRLKSQADLLHNVYRPRSFFEKIGHFFKSIGKGLLNLGKGLVQGVVQLGKGIFKTLTDIPKGLFNGVKKLLHGDIGGAFKAVGQGVVNSVKDGFKTVKDGLPTLATIASFIPGLDAVAIPLRAALAVKGGVEGIKNGDVLGGLAAVAGGVAGGAGAAGLSRVAQTATVVERGALMGVGTQALANGDVLGGVGAVAGGFASNPGKVGRTAGQVEMGAYGLQSALSVVRPQTSASDPGALGQDSFGASTPPSWL